MHESTKISFLKILSTYISGYENPKNTYIKYAYTQLRK